MRFDLVPATPLSRVGIGLQTGGFASPPHGGFALYDERQLIAFPKRRQSVSGNSHVAEWRPRLGELDLFENSNRRHPTPASAAGASRSDIDSHARSPPRISKRIDVFVKEKSLTTRKAARRWTPTKPA